jgi:hydrogenase maturation protease
MSSRTNGLLVLGLGNVLLSDDGIGPAAIALLQEQHAAAGGVRVLDGGTLGLTLLSHIEDANNVILVDAVKADAPAGTLVRPEGEEVGPAVATRLSPHQVGVADLLDAARWHDRQPPRLVLLGIVPESFELGVGLSRVVSAALPALVHMIVAEAQAVGHSFAKDAPSRLDRTLNVARLAFAGAP